MDQPRPTFRETVSGRFTDFLAPTLLKNSSGFVLNAKLCDGTGWVPERCLHGDQVRTEYRMRYNSFKPFHKLVTPVTAGKLPKKYQIYDLFEKKNKQKAF